MKISKNLAGALALLAVLPIAMQGAADAASPAAKPVAATAPATAAAGNTTSAPAAPPVIKITPYPLDICVVSGDKIGAMGKPIVLIQDGQEVRFCCNDCPAEFAQDTPKFMKMIAAALQSKAASATPAKELPAKPYPLDICAVRSTSKLGSMGAPLTVIYNGQEIKLCCKDCLKDFYKDPMAVMQKIDDAQKKAKN